MHEEIWLQSFAPDVARRVWVTLVPAGVGGGGGTGLSLMHPLHLLRGLQKCSESAKTKTHPVSFSIILACLTCCRNPSSVLFLHVPSEDPRNTIQLWIYGQYLTPPWINSRDPVMRLQL